MNAEGLYALTFIILICFTENVAGGRVVYKNNVYIIDQENLSASRKPRGRRLFNVKHNCDIGQTFSSDLQIITENPAM
ncbi:hypothetical protein NQ315_007576 [Exocentrus adspersus]|uniref:Uncharacterized protein n=1 Tax=Exocentrus adspersus TaxID=1586481 RepID=A0AAV8W7J8_9CUCU|nr:hypothetical protein NQ315_007576 [Exocentrus adspersus]